MEKYIYFLDISLSNSGLTIFKNDGTIIKIDSISTNAEKEHKDKLKIVADYILDVRKKYYTELLVYEQGFSRYALSTQAIFKTLGVIQYLFADCKQECIAPATIRKVICGSGRASKDDVWNVVMKAFPGLVLKDNDQSDAIGLALCYFKERGISVNKDLSYLHLA